MSVTMTDKGIRLYSKPNWDGRSIEGSGWDTWGGLCLSPMETSNCLINGHRYIIMWHCSGQTSVSMSDIYWTNNVGWGQAPDANPTRNAWYTVPANFQGETDCFYDFTITDSVFKTTGDSVHSGFEANTTYLAYAAFKIGFTYRQTGALGTDLYLTNFRMYDITNGFQQCQYTKQGILDTTEVIELPSSLFTNAQIQKSGNIITSNLYEI